MPDRYKDRPLEERVDHLEELYAVLAPLKYQRWAAPLTIATLVIGLIILVIVIGNVKDRADLGVKIARSTCSGQVEGRKGNRATIVRGDALLGTPGSPGYDYWTSHPKELAAQHAETAYELRRNYSAPPCLISRGDRDRVQAIYEAQDTAIRKDVAEGKRAP